MSLIMFGIFYWLSLPQDMEQIDNTTTILLSAFKNGVNRFLFVLSDAKPELWDKKLHTVFLRLISINILTNKQKEVSIDHGR